MKHLPLLLLLTACPQDLSSANIVPGDGGLWVPNNDGGVTFVDPGDSPLDVEVLPDLPPMEVLCMLRAGDWSERNEYEKTQGIWINDIQDQRFLGPPAPNAKYVGQESAQLRYTYRKPGTTDEKVSISMGFEKLIVVDAVGADLMGDGTANRGNPWPDPWFLNRVEAQGLDEQPLCWDPFLRNSTEHHWVLCDWCMTMAEDFIECRNEDPKACFY